MPPVVQLRDGRLGLQLQAERAGDFADAGEAGGGVVGGFVALDLLLFQTQPIGQFVLAQAGGFRATCSASPGIIDGDRDFRAARPAPRNQSVTSAADQVPA